MGAPEYVPTNLGQQPRRGLALPPPGRWTPDRPGELGPAQPSGTTLGSQGPDQGYALLLAERVKDRVRLAEGEHLDDVLVGCVAVALKRASRFGRAPVIHDLLVALRVWGYLGDAPEDLVALRRPLFQAAGHRYGDQRAIADLVPDETLGLTPAQVDERHAADWRSLLSV